MDFSSFFSLPCMLVILTIIDGRVSADIIPVVGLIGGEIVFPLEIQNLSDLTTIEVIDAYNCSCMNLSRECCNTCNRQMCLKKNGFLEIKHLSKSDAGEYNVFLETTGNRTSNRTFRLDVCEASPIVHIHCRPDGSAELFCDVDSFSSGGVYWTLNGKHMNDTDACVKDDGKRITLEKGISGNLTCHRKSTCGIFSMVVVSCDDDLLKHPLFLILLAACGGAAILLAVIASLVTCCCVKSKHNFIPVPAEDEKDEGVTLSAISSEGPKNPPNGDHCEPTDVLADSTPNPGSEICQSSKPEPKTDPGSTVEPQVEPGPNAEIAAGTGTEFREVMVDSEPVEDVDDCFPDPVDG